MEKIPILIHMFLKWLRQRFVFCFLFFEIKVVLDVWWFGKVAKDICQMVDNYSLVIQHSWLKDFLIGTTSTTCRCSKLCLRVIYWGSNLEIGWNTQLDPKNFLRATNDDWEYSMWPTFCRSFSLAPKKMAVPSLWHESLDGNMLATFTAAFPAPPQKKNIWDGRLKKNLENHPLRHPFTTFFWRNKSWHPFRSHEKTFPWSWGVWNVAPLNG